MYQPELIGVVVIGRNEGARLLACLDSLLPQTRQIVYVDSGSTDNSVTEATKRGVTVVNLDMSRPFTAARARNQGAEALLQQYPNISFIQFVDGDCEVNASWLPTAQAALDAEPGLAVVCGRRRERYPERSIYNRMCDIEWDTPIGEAKACGGDMLIRSAAFRQVNGYNPALIAGEEPEMCVRLRAKGWKIMRLNAEMTLHDANMMHFSQWWKRSQRAGYAYAEGAKLHGAPPEQHWVKERNRGWIWAFFVPLICLALTCFCPLLGLLALSIYPLQIFRTSRQFMHLGTFKWKQASFLMLGKFAEITGQIKFYKNSLLRKQGKLIEYKS